MLHPLRMLHPLSMLHPLITLAIGTQLCPEPY